MLVHVAKPVLMALVFVTDFTFDFVFHVQVNITLKQLILTHNKFCEDGGMWIGKILGKFFERQCGRWK